MGNPEISKDFTKKIDQIKTNLKSWTLPEWILLFRDNPGSPFPGLSPSPGYQEFIFHFEHDQSLEPADLVSVQ